MAGLLDYGNADTGMSPQDMGLLALAAGMTQGNIGAGLMGYVNTTQGAKAQALKNQDLEQQIQLRNIALQQQQQEWGLQLPMLQAMAKRMNGGQPQESTDATPGTPAIPAMGGGALGSGTFGISVPAQAATAPAPAQSRVPTMGGSGGSSMFPGVPDSVALPTAAFGGFKAMLPVISKYNEPTELMKTLRAQGIVEGSPEWIQAMRDNVTKTNYVAPTNIRGFGIATPKGLQPLPMNAPQGFMPSQDASGNWTFAQVGNGTQAVQQSSQATQLGKLGGTLNQGVDENNNPTYFMGAAPGTVGAPTGAAGPQAGSLSAPAPLRNNNPGALMPGGKLAQYPDIATGIAALDQNLQNYGKGGINTLAGVISKWAPSSENDTGAYIKDVATRLGIAPNQPIDLGNAAVRHAIGTGIMLHENGVNGVFQQPAQPPQGAQGPQAAGVIRPGLSPTATALTQQGADFYKSATNDAQNIGQTRQMLDEIKTLASDPKNTFGPGTPQMARIKALANNVGIDMTGAQTAQDVMGKLASNIVMSQLGQGNQTGSDAQMNQWIHANPNGEMTNNAILQVVPLLHQQLDVKEARARVINNAVGSTQNFSKVPDVVSRFNRVASPPVVSLGTQLAQASQNGTLATFMKSLTPAQRMLLPQVKQLDGMGAF